MRPRLLVALLALGLAAGCRGPDRVDFPAGTTMARLQAAGTVAIGVKYDQPGVGFRNLATRELEGFDIELARIVARRLGIDEDRIRWVSTVSDDREKYLKAGRVDLVIASYSITPDRSDLVGQAGPYLVAGQQLLVRKTDDRITGPKGLAGRHVCSVVGSTSLVEVKRLHAQPVGRATYTQCVQMLLGGGVDAVSTDDAILLGYVGQQPDKLKVVGPPFTTERYGIGYYPPGDHALCQFLTETIRLAKEDGSWAAAFERTLGRAGAPMPLPPDPDPCPPPASG
jgi:glutamate transport system substrate-binding protein